MLRIKKGKNQLVVSHGAYKTMYKPLGYKPLMAPDGENPLNPDNSHQPTNLGSTEEPGSSGHGDGQDFPTPKQIRGMNTHQLMQYAESWGIDTSGVGNKAELVDLVLEYTYQGV